MVVVRWQDWSGETLECLVLLQGPDGIVADATIEGKDGALATRYRIICDASWRTRRAEIHLVDGRNVELESDGNGNWEMNKCPAPRLRGAIDVDITVTPFTNTLPIRRLNLRANQHEDILVAYVSVPELAVTSDPQRYICIEPGTLYRFESSGGEFVRDIRVDENGLVVEYPGLFKRVV